MRPAPFALAPFPRAVLLICFLASIAVALHAAPGTVYESRPPNFIVIFTDDQGYNDVGVFGAPDIRTPHLDRMAAGGARLTSFYAAFACSPARASLMTGCYAPRVGLPSVIGPASRIALNHDEITLPEVLKQRGYATAMYGKWHLGHTPDFLPTRHGFDEYFGIPYSNDMWPLHPQRPEAYPDLPLIEGEEVIELNPDQNLFTRRFTERAVQFMERHRETPFFIYLAHPMPHVPLHASDDFSGRSPRGLYGDVIEEIDWSVGEVLAAVQRLGLDERTLVLFTSDNGPWLQYGDHGGSAAPLRYGKGTTWEGGPRVPCIVRWPGRIPAGIVIPDVATIMDVLPTFVRLAGSAPPADRIIDGHDIWNLLSGRPGARSPYDALAYYRAGALGAVRAGSWKLHLPRPGNPHETFPASSFNPARTAPESWPLMLFNLENDPGEQNDVAEKHPNIVARLTALADHFRETLGDTQTGARGTQIRPPGRF